MKELLFRGTRQRPAPSVTADHVTPSPARTGHRSQLCAPAVPTTAAPRTAWPGLGHPPLAPPLVQARLGREQSGTAGRPPPSVSMGSVASHLGTGLMGMPCAGRSSCLKDRAAQSCKNLFRVPASHLQPHHPHWILHQLSLCPCAPPGPTDLCHRGSAPGMVRQLNTYQGNCSSSKGARQRTR